MSKGRALVEGGPVVWLKEKHSCPKQNGRYKGGSNTAAKKTDRKRKKVGGGPSPIEHVMVITVEGRTTWQTRPRAVKR